MMDDKERKLIKESKKEIIKRGKLDKGKVTK